MRELCHTSQWSRIADSPPTTDLRGGKASEDPFTMLMANLVVAYAVDFQFVLFSGTAFGSTVSSEDFGWLPSSLLGMY